MYHTFLYGNLYVYDIMFSYENVCLRSKRLLQIHAKRPVLSYCCRAIPYVRVHKYYESYVYYDIVPFASRTLLKSPIRLFSTLRFCKQHQESVQTQDGGHPLFRRLSKSRGSSNLASVTSKTPWCVRGNDWG